MVNPNKFEDLVIKKEFFDRRAPSSISGSASFT